MDAGRTAGGGALGVFGGHAREAPRRCESRRGPDFGKPCSGRGGIDTPGGSQEGVWVGVGLTDRSAIRHLERRKRRAKLRGTGFAVAFRVRHRLLACWIGTQASENVQLSGSTSTTVPRSRTSADFVPPESCVIAPGRAVGEESGTVFASGSAMRAPSLCATSARRASSSACVAPCRSLANAPSSRSMLPREYPSLFVAWNSAALGSNKPCRYNAWRWCAWPASACNA